MDIEAGKKGMENVVEGNPQQLNGNDMTLDRTSGMAGGNLEMHGLNQTPISQNGM